QRLIHLHRRRSSAKGQSRSLTQSSNKLTSCHEQHFFHHYEGARRLTTTTTEGGGSGGKGGRARGQGSQGALGIQLVHRQPTTRHSSDSLRGQDLDTIHDGQHAWGRTRRARRHYSPGRMRWTAVWISRGEIVGRRCWEGGPNQHPGKLVKHVSLTNELSASQRGWERTVVDVGGVGRSSLEGFRKGAVTRRARKTPDNDNDGLHARQRGHTHLPTLPKT
ncbi:hypothetical protein DFP72DRAFT_915070, partial [Ephemerocybe angulata]